MAQGLLVSRAVGRTFISLLIKQPTKKEIAIEKLKNMSTKIFCLKILLYGLRFSFVFVLIRYKNNKSTENERITEIVSLIIISVFHNMIAEMCVFECQLESVKEDIN